MMGCPAIPRVHSSTDRLPLARSVLRALDRPAFPPIVLTGQTPVRCKLWGGLWGAGAFSAVNPERDRHPLN